MPKSSVSEMGFFLLVCAFLVVGAVYLFMGHPAKMYRTNEPLRIIPNGEFDNSEFPCYILPAETVLYYDTTMAEGFDVYTIYVNFQGKLDATEIPMRPEWRGNYVAPVWLEEITAEDLGELARQRPLTKKDILQIIQANGLTREDLAEIMKELPESN